MNRTNIESKWDIITDIPTYILQSPNATKMKNLIIIIPGNPGVAEYYQDFMDELYKKLNGKFGIICISHAGHVSVPLSLQNNKDNKVHFDYSILDNQMQHKLYFIKQNISLDSNIILIGHSIGCYIILHMLEEIQNLGLKLERVDKCILLFPTIERMAISPMGKSFTSFVKYFYWILIIIVNIIHHFIPKALLRLFIDFALRKNESKDCAIEATLKVVSPVVFNNAVRMAKFEMETVTEANYQIISKYLSKLIFYYGTDDHWCPNNYAEEMKQKYPSANLFVAHKKHEHAFVLNSSREVAVFCVENYIL